MATLRWALAALLLGAAGRAVATGWTTPRPSSNWWIKTARCEHKEGSAAILLEK
jgi:hypothetical protein